MKESFEAASQAFVYPDIMKEAGEFERVALTFSIDTSVLLFQAKDGEMTSLDEDMWQKLENTDSNRFESGDWDKVAEYATMAERDWQSIHNSTSGIDAPIIMKFGDRYHLVAGNTRLMVARARGINPKVLLFSIDMPPNSPVDEHE